jgi:hypothetical protein
MSFTFHISAHPNLTDKCIAKSGHVTQEFCSRDIHLVSPILISTDKYMIL